MSVNSLLSRFIVRRAGRKISDNTLAIKAFHLARDIGGIVSAHSVYNGKLAGIYFKYKIEYLELLIFRKGNRLAGCAHHHQKICAAVQVFYKFFETFIIYSSVFAKWRNHGHAKPFKLLHLAY